ncbi:MAG: DUF1571 domain-containing protein [Deltaproteobacteria bacterium]|nr:DUF1571 domain-containing protein [Deltaproteobacteria bacterium]MBI5811006.1 DUF1571 domain-containing protein [Deltaproteobacteria bacterium]
MDPISAAVESYRGVSSYRATLVSTSDGDREVIRYFYKRPGYVRMEFVTPHSGAVLVYDPVKGTAALRPFGSLKPLAFSLSPENRLIKSRRGHTVDRSDIGALLSNVEALRKSGGMEIAGDEPVGGRQASKVNVRGDNGISVDGINRYILWFDKKTGLPLKAVAFDRDGKAIEDVLMDDIEVTPDPPESFFTLD